MRLVISASRLAVVRLHASRSAEEALRQAPQSYILGQGVVAHLLLFVIEFLLELYPLCR